MMDEHLVIRREVMDVASAELVTELVRAHTVGDERRWLNLLSQLIAAESRAGHVRQAARLRELLGEANEMAASRRTAGESRPIQLARAPRDLVDILDVKYSDVGLRDLVLDDPLRVAMLRVLDEQRMADRLADHGLTPRRRLLLHGPPGCGKTMAAYALAGDLRLPLARVRLEVLFSKYLGETAATLAELFEQIRRTRAVYLFDEFDALGKQRGDDYDVGEVKRVVGTFLQLLDADSSESLIIAATNLGGSLDTALLRRFDDVLEFPSPTDESMSLLLNRLLRVHDFDEDQVNTLVAQARGLSFAEARAAVNNARKVAILDDRTSPDQAEVSAELAARPRSNSL
jgi:SpoVK/Ycf46/Vps4 family AAA+-type ATPase